MILVYGLTKVMCKLTHQRLAIIDLTQPDINLWCASGRYVLCFNGKIYNHKDLRFELDRQGKSPTWQGSSDTETILGYIDAYGLKKLLQDGWYVYSFMG